MEEDLTKKVLQDLEEARNWDERIPESVFENAKEKLVGILESNPEVIEKLKYRKSWAAGALHRAMMEEIPSDRMTVEELADRYGVSASTAGDRSRRFRQSSQFIQDMALSLTGHYPEVGDPDSEDFEEAAEALFDMFTSPMASEGPQLETDSLQPLLEEISVQTEIGSPFDFEKFFRENPVPDSAKESFIQAARRGVERFLSATEEEKDSVDSVQELEKLLGDPEALGYLVYEVLGGDYPLDLKEVVARYALSLVLQSGDSSYLRIFFAPLVPVAWLAQKGELSGEALYVASRYAMESHRTLYHLRPEDIEPFWKAVLEDEGMDREQKLELLHFLFDRAGKTSNSHLGPQLLEAIRQRREDLGDLYEDLLERIIFNESDIIPPLWPQRSVRKKALKFRAEVGEDKEKFLTRAFEYALKRNRGGLQEGIAEFIGENISQLDREKAETLAERGLSCNDAKPRRAFFKTAYQLDIDDVLMRGKNDRAPSIQDWARSKRSESDT